MPARPAPATALTTDAWPRTWRLLPWLVVAFTTMIYLVPFDDVQLPVQLPMDSTLDRLVLPAVALLWLAALITGSRAGPRFRGGLVDGLMLAFLTTAGLSVLLHYDDVVERGELGLAMRRLIVLSSYVLFYFIASSVLRPGEVRAFGRLLIGLGGLLAAGVLYQNLSGVNLFHDVAGVVFDVTASPSNPRDVDALGRWAVTGPTHHGLVAASLLAVSLCFAALELASRPSARARVLLIATFGLIVAGGFATFRKSSAVLPAVGLLTFLVAYPRAIRTIVPVAAVSLALVAVLVPSAIGAVVAQLGPDDVRQSGSIGARLSDYRVVAPDVVANTALGRGYGTYDSVRYRLLDNQYLKLLIETGTLGLLAYVAVIAAVLAAAMAVRLRRGPARGPPGAALLAAVATVVVANGVYDALGYPHVGYLFSLLAALVVVAGAPAVIADTDRHADAVVAVVAPPRRPRLALAARVSAVLAVCAVAGVWVGSLSAGAAPETAESATLAVEMPAGWERSAATAELADPAMVDAVALRSPDGLLVAGIVNTTGPTLLSPRLRALLAPPPRREPVRVGALDWYRYVGAEPDGAGRRITLYAAPTTRGVATVACLTHRAARVCERVAGTLRLLRGRPFPLGPSPRFAALVERVVERLDAARGAGRAGLRTGPDTAAQARAAERVANAYARARGAIARASVSPADRGARDALAAGLAAAGAGYRALARAAAAGDRTAYAGARRRVIEAERRVASGLRRLSRSGYRVTP